MTTTGFVRCARRLCAAATVLVLFAIVGCGGGGSASNAYIDRSYLYAPKAAAATTVAITVDPAGHFTIFAAAPTTLPDGAAGQGTVQSGSGQFSVSSGDGTVAFAGQFAPDGTSVTGTVRKNGSLVVGFTAGYVSSTGTTPGTLAGTYTANTTGQSALVTANATGQTTVWASAGTASGGALANIGSDGTLTAEDGSLAGTLTSASSGYQLVLTKLGGTTLSPPATIALRKPFVAKWTFLVFLNAANDLQPFADGNVNQMADVGSTADVNIVVQWKQANCTNCGSPTWVGTRRYFITKGSATPLQDMGTSVDMGDWRTLLQFIQWGQQNYPADHYAVVLWDHGAGWLNAVRAPGLAETYRSVSIDYSTNNEIETWELPSGLNVTPKVDMVVFDASLMQMAEVLYEIRNSTSIVVGSEESPPGLGYYYNTFLSDLVANPNMTPADFGKQIVTRTLEAYANDTTNGPEITQSEVDTSKMADVASKLSAFGTSLILHKADSSAAEVYARQNAEEYKYTDNKDLYDYADLIRTNAAPADLKTAAANLEASIDAAVLTEAHGSAHPHSHGIAIYVPDPGNFRSTYTNLALARATSWPAWLQDEP